MTKRLVLALMLMTIAATVGFQQLIAAPIQAEGAQAAEDPWAFADDEEAARTWMDDIRDQAVGISLMLAFWTLAMVGFFRKSEKLKWITMGAAVLYLGVYQSQLVSVTNIFALVRNNLPVFRDNLALYLFFILTIATTILWGRIYCGRVCAFGSMTQLLDKVVPARLRLEIPKKIEQRANYIKYGLLVSVLGYYLLTNDFLIYRYVEPFWMFSREAALPLWIGLGVLLVATVFVRNLYCRFLCPVGAFLGILSKLTVFRIKRWQECNTCKICEKACEWGAIRGPKIIASECVRCDDCERLYDDKEKCPHWLILLRKKAKAASVT